MRLTAAELSVGEAGSVLDVIAALRATGQSYDRIAVTLNDLGLRGPQGGRWFGGTVYRLARQHLGHDHSSSAGSNAMAQEKIK